MKKENIKGVSLLKHFREGVAEAGCDEAGRGCLAGPVYAAAVIFPPNFYHEDINDSKKLNREDREELKEIIEKNAICFSVASVDHLEIDRINILNASILAMHRALDQLKHQPEFIIVDGNKFKPYKKISHQCVIGRDAKYMSIAAASILAKTYRDNYMDELHLLHPEYGWDRNRAYATRAHRDAILEYGLTPFHRKNFVKNLAQLSLGL